MTADVVFRADAEDHGWARFLVGKRGIDRLKEQTATTDLSKGPEPFRTRSVEGVSQRQFIHVRIESARVETAGAGGRVGTRRRSESSSLRVSLSEPRVAEIHVVSKV